MTYALLQTTMNPPPVDALQRAFRDSRSLSSADAVFVADDAFGMLARDLPEDEAQSIAAFLAAEGVHVDVVAEGDLPRLPEAQFFLSARPEGPVLELFDALERAESIPWPALRLIAVGYDQREVRLELVAGDALLRYSTTMARLHFHPGPETGGRSPAGKLLALLRRLRERAPRAWLNRGAEALLSEDAPERIEDLTAYPRPSAFHEELVWLLWRARKADEAEGAGEAGTRPSTGEA